MAACSHCSLGCTGGGVLGVVCELSIGITYVTSV